MAGRAFRDRHGSHLGFETVLFPVFLKHGSDRALNGKACFVYSLASWSTHWEKLQQPQV